MRVLPKQRFLLTGCRRYGRGSPTSPPDGSAIGSRAQDLWGF